MCDWSSYVFSSDLHDIARARSRVGWEPKQKLRETLPTIVAALKRHPRAWYRNNKLNENLGGWNDNSVSKLAELDPHKPEAAAGEMAGMVHGAMEIGRASCRERVCQYV